MSFFCTQSEIVRLQWIGISFQHHQSQPISKPFQRACNHSWAEEKETVKTGLVLHRCKTDNDISVLATIQIFQYVFRWNFQIRNGYYTKVGFHLDISLYGQTSPYQSLYNLKTWTFVISYSSKNHIFLYKTIDKKIVEFIKWIKKICL